MNNFGILLILVQTFLFCFGGKLIFYHLKLQYFTAAPDGVTRRILGVNRMFPGPTLRAKLGDTLVVNVTNKIGRGETTSIHWHGLEQVMTAFQDGLEGVTQCGIPYGETMTYTLDLRQAGTYWWHSHHSTQYTDGCWGALIIDNTREVYKYDRELTFTLNEWHHANSAILLKWYLSKESNGIEPIPDSIMINGKGNYPCEFAQALKPPRTCREPNPKYGVYEVERGRLYRIRIINTSSMANFNFSIDGHELETIEIDGVDTVQVKPVDVVRIFSGMRYSFLVKMDEGKVGKSFWIRSSAFLSAYNPSTPNINKYPEAFFQNSEVRAILQYVNPSSKTSFVGEIVPRPPKIDGLPNGPEIEVEAVQGRPATHDGVDWNNITAVIQAFEKLETTHRNFTYKNQYKGQKKSGSQESTPVRSKIITSKFIETPFTSPKNSGVKTLNPNDCIPKDGRKAYSTYDQLVELTINFFKDENGVVLSGFNRIPFETGREPILYKVTRGEPLPREAHPIYTDLNIVVQIVVNNPNPGGHPIHLHGHTFWVVGTGTGIYNETRDSKSLILNGARRDTTTVGPFGWMAIRYKTDNPGPWLLHCHYNWHLHSGLGAVFIEGEWLLKALSTRWFPVEAYRICEYKYL